MSFDPLGSDHSRAWKGLNFKSGRSTALYRCISRLRFTGPGVRYTCQSSSSNTVCNRLTISSLAPVSSSSRTASPLRRLCSSVRTLSSTERDSSSCKYRLLLRVMRKAPSLMIS